jgi:hypothetical protein
MAGAIPIIPTPLDIARLRRLLNNPGSVGMWLTVLDEGGWRAAQDWLDDWARRDAEQVLSYQQTEGDTQ